MKQRDIAIERAKVLQQSVQDFLSYKNHTKVIEEQRHNHYLSQKAKLLAHFSATEKDWEDYHWQLRHSFTTIDEVLMFIHLPEQRINEIRKVQEDHRFSMTPYYLANMTDDELDPFLMQALPSIQEIIDTTGKEDPMAEEFTNPAGSITRRYPDRLIINVSNMCAMYCRHCQRRRLIGENDHHTSEEDIAESIEYISNHPEIRDVLVTGGDAFMLSDNKIESLLKRLRAIKHVEIIRFGSRTPVSLPMRITTNLVAILKKYHPVYVNTHFNHPFEVTEVSKKACNLLADAGVSIGNQMVLLKNINNEPNIVKYLNQKLLTTRVRPYYIFHAKRVKGTHHFEPTIKEGLQIMEELRGHTSGMAIPTYIINAPGGLGKVPLLPHYYEVVKEGVYRIRTWEQNTFEYRDN